MGKHIHHIIPRYMGGTNDPSNLIELSVEEHAEAHKKLWEENGNWQDLIAWKSLSGQISGDDLRREITRLTWLGRNHSPESIEKIKKARSKQITTEETRKKMSLARKGKKLNWETNTTTPEANAKRSETMKGRPKEKIQCPHCKKVGGKPQMIQWHFDNCKERI
jgi:hypothetical protein